MEWTGLACVLFATFLTISAEPEVSSPMDNRPQHSEAAELYNRNKPVREGALLQLADYVTHGDTLLKERLKKSHSNLKELLEQGDAVLKERMLEGEAQVKEQLKDGDGRLKEELDEDVAWLKDRLAKGQRRVQEELREEQEKTSNEMTELKEAFEKLQNSVQIASQRSCAPIDDLKQQMSDFQAELNSTKHQLQTTRTELRTNQQTLLQSTQETVQSLIASEIERLQSSHRLGPSSSSEMEEERNFSDIGSTFIRWGCTTCPNNTSLVYAGVAGGSWYDHVGGASNYLCLVMDPQLSNESCEWANHVYGVEYDAITGPHNQDVVCSVCRAPQATTLMIPATLTCPAGWTTQYKGTLMSTHHSYKGRTEYVCVDEAREHRDGGYADQNGALFCLVITKCGSLPCPPYVHAKVVTCVVCSM